MMCRVFILSIFSLLILLKGYSQDFKHVPGTVVHYQPTSTQKYIGSPSLVVLENGDYVASHDFFGPQSSEWQQAVTTLYNSKNKGKTWKKLSEINGAFWSSLFVHKGDLYLLGTDRHHGTVLIRKSSDQGKTLTKPKNKENGVLLTGEFHCAPMPVIEHNGRLWRPMETTHGPSLKWGERYGAMVMSASIDSDLLNSKSWQTSNTLLYNNSYLDGNFKGWLEGNFVIGPNQQMWNILRVDNASSFNEKAAMIKISEDGKALDFNPVEGFIPFDGGSKKFVIKYDSLSGYYYTLVNSIPEKYRNVHSKRRNPAQYRNVLMLRKSKDLFHWEDVKVILEHKDLINHGFQYVDWLFEGNDLIVLCRTAFHDGTVDAKNNHDANFLTFHRIENFRQ